MTKIRKFETGATRNLSDHKIDYDGFLSASALRRFGEYMHTKRVQADGVIRDSDNWKKGIPTNEYRKSLLRHVMDLKRIDEGETVYDDDTKEKLDRETLLCAILFNTQGYLFELLKAKN